MAPDKTVIGKDRIIEMIPQRAPFVMIDELISTSDEKSESSLEIREENIFCIDSKLTEPGLIENIAQTAAARGGYLSKINNVDPPLGYIGAIKNLEIHFLPEVNKRINTEIILENLIMDVAIIKGYVRCEGKLAAECEMKIFYEKKV